MVKIPLDDTVDVAQGEAGDDLSHARSDPEKGCVLGAST
jgi:hypothetical protein